ncbi:hypothetical protein ACVI1L_000914 [Bradyrhizobium sp. USDA 4516]
MAAKRMIERSLERFDLYPSRLLGDSGYGSAEMLAWLVYEHGIEPHVTVFDKSARTDGIFSLDDFTYDHAGDIYRCPGGKVLTTTGTLVNDGATMLYLASKRDCDRCALKARCCPKQASRRVPRSIYEGARDMARQIARSWEGGASRRLRKKIEMLFAHLKRILKLDRLRLRGPNGARDEFILAATAHKPSKDGQADPDAHPEARIGSVEQFGHVAAELLKRNTASLFQRNRPYADIRHPGPRPLGLGSANGATSTVALSVARSRSIVSRTC